MEPISMIIAALGAGAIAATEDTAGTAVKDAYYITDIFEKSNTNKFYQPNFWGLIFTFRSNKQT